MTIYKVGSKGDAVRQIQTQLKAAGFDPGPIDGIYGGGTAAAVRGFQAANGLAVDGIVGPQTWAALTPGATSAAPSVRPTPTPTPTPTSKPTPVSGPVDGTSDPDAWPLKERCVALTGSIETGLGVPECFSGLSGNFDGQGISFGAMQQNFGQGSLQPLLTRMVKEHGDVAARVFGDHLDELTRMLAEPNKADQVEWAVSIQSPKNVVRQPWSGYFKALGATPEYQAIQADAATSIYDKGVGYCRQFGLRSERAVALMFDIVVQNGSISNTVAAQINADFAALPPDSGEQPKLEIVARRRASVCNPRWVQDVLTRKLMIADGGGVVHGLNYDLGEEYKITLDPVPGL